jgi:hypothetical protein
MPLLNHTLNAYKLLTREINHFVSYTTGITNEFVGDHQRKYGIVC